MGHREGLAGPGHGDAPALQQAESLVVPAVAAGGVGIEHHPHPHAALVGPQQGLLHSLALQLELLHQKLLAGLIDQLDHGIRTVVGHHEQALSGAGNGAHQVPQDCRTF